MARKKLNPKEASKIQVQLADGSVWNAEVDASGTVYLVSQVKPPKSPASGTGEPEEKPTPPSKSAEEYLEEMLGGLPTRMPKSKPREDQPEKVKPMPGHVKKRLDDPAFRARLSSIMLDNKYDRRLRGRTRGKLDMTRLFKAPTLARNLFTKKEARRGKQYNVVLLVDESGSMRDSDKSWVAAECAVFLAKAFEGINVNVAIIGFNEYITVRKEFTQPCDYDRVYQAIGTMNFRRGEGWNYDYEAMERAYAMFDHAPEGKNILIMLSDGQPAPGATGKMIYVNAKGQVEHPIRHPHTLSREETEERTHLHHLVKANAHRVDSFGIGILEGGWQIPNHEVVKDLNELKPTIIKVLKRKITRG